MGESDQGSLEGPDLEQGVPLSQLEDGKPFLGHACGESVVLVKHGDSVFALSATCTHYGGPLQEGVVGNGKIRCPWHHAKFDLVTGRASGPALGSLGCFEVSFGDGAVKVVGRREAEDPERAHAAPSSVAIVGAGPAGAACAEQLRLLGYEGPIKMIGWGEPYPVDRPNLSKDYLAGNAPAEWLPLHTADWYGEHDIEFVTERVIGLDTEHREVRLEGGHTIPFDAALLATGAEPRRLPIDGAELGHVHMLRSLADAEKLSEAVEGASEAVVIGAGFIGLEVAASLRERDVDVTVVAPERVPLEQVVGLELGQLIESVHEDGGVKFELGKKPQEIDADGVTLDDGAVLSADVVVIGIGVEPRTELAEEAGLEVADGVVVDHRLRTSVEGVYAAGDIARFPVNGSSARVEHFAVAVRQGQSVARTMLGLDVDTDVPYFWSRHFGMSISYVGYASDFDEVRVSGSLADRDATIGYFHDGDVAAVATVGRDDVSLLAEIAMEDGDQERLHSLLER